MWTAQQIDVLKQLWTAGKSAAQIAAQVGNSRSAVCAKLSRLNLKRGRIVTARPKILSGPRRAGNRARSNSERRSIASQGAIKAVERSSQPLRPLRRVIRERPPQQRPVEFTKTQLRAMLAEAVRNTG